MGEADFETRQVGYKAFMSYIYKIILLIWGNAHNLQKAEHKHIMPIMLIWVYAN